MRFRVSVVVGLLIMFFIIPMSGQDFFWVGGNGDWGDANHWSLSSGGAGGAGIPNIQNNVFFDANSFTGANQEVRVNINAFCTDMDWTGATGNPQFTGMADQVVTIHGSLAFINDMQFPFEGNVEFRAMMGSHTITSAGQTFFGDLIFEGAATWTLTDALTVLRALRFREGTFISADNNIQVFTIYSDFPNNRTFDFGNSTVRLTQFVAGNGPSATFANSNLTWIPSSTDFIFEQGDQGTMIMTGDAVFDFGSIIFDTEYGILDSETDLPPRINTLHFIQDGEVNGNHDIPTWIFAMGHTVFLENGSTQNVEDFITGDVCDGLASIVVKDGRGPIAILDFDRVPSVSIEGLYLRGVHAANSSGFRVDLIRSRNGGNIGNVWIFQTLPPVDKYWVGGTGDWNDRSNWSDTSGGAGEACLPNQGDNIFFDEFSFQSPTDEVTSRFPVFVNDLTFTATGFNGALNIPGLYINEDLEVSTFLNWNIPEVFLIGNNQAGNSGNTDIQFINAPLITFTNITSESQREIIITSDLNISGSLIIDGFGNRAIFNIGNNQITVNEFTSTNSDVVIELDNGTVLITGAIVGGMMPLTILQIGGIIGNGVWELDNVNSGLESDQSGFTDVIFSNDQGEGTVLGNGQVIIDNLTFLGDGFIIREVVTVSNLNLSAGHTYEVDTITMFEVLDSISAPGTICAPVVLRSASLTDYVDMILVNVNTDLMTYVEIQNVNALGGTPYAGDGSVNVGNNAGWRFPSQMDNESIEEFLGVDIRVCGDSTVVLQPFEASEITAIVWNNGESTDLSFPVSERSNPGVNLIEIIAEVSFVDGCDLTDTIEVAFDNLFDLEIGNDTIICEGASLQLNANVVDADSYEWSNSDTGQFTIVNSTGLYELTAVKGACAATADIQVTLAELEDFTLGSDTTFCEGSIYIFEAPNISTGTFMWSDSTSSPTFEIRSTGAYWLEVSQGNCSLRDSVMVSYDNLFNLEIGNDTIICEGTSLQLDANVIDADTYSWSNSDTGQITIVNSTGLYELTAVRGACADTADIQVTVAELEDFTLGTDTTFCEGSIYIFEAPNISTGTFMWSDSTSSPTFEIRSAGTYWLEVSQGNCSLRDSVVVSYDNLFNLEIGNDTIICEGTSLQLDANVIDADTYSWSNSDTGQITIVNSTGLYELTAVRGACADTADIQVTVAELEDFTLGPDTTFCEGSIYIIEAPNISTGTFMWSDSTSSPTFEIRSAGIYGLEVSLGNCSLRDSVMVSFDTAINLDIGDAIAICSDSALIIDAGAGSDLYTWSTGSSDQMIQVSTTGVYSVEVTRGACRELDDVNVRVDEAPTFSLGNDSLICENQLVTLFAPEDSGLNITWSDGSQASSLTISSAGSYWLEAALNQCSTRDSIKIFVQTLEPLFIGNDTTLCQGEVLVIDVLSTAQFYNWSNGLSDPTIAIDMPGTYSVEVIDSACITYDTIVVDFLTLDGLDLGPDTVLCEGTPLRLDATLSGITDYTWTELSSGAMVSSDPIIDVTSAGDYQVQLSNATCMSTADITVAFDAAINFDGLGNDTTLCVGESLDYNFNLSDVEYLWQDGSNNSNYTITDSGLYYLSVIRNSCVASDSIIVNVVSLPNIGLPDSLSFCEGESANLSVIENNDSYLWSTGEQIQQIQITSSGIYTVEVSNTSCSTSDSSSIVFNPLPDINLGPDQVICDSDLSIIEMTVADLDAQWASSDSIGLVITLFNDDFYSISITDLNECSNTDTVNLAINPSPTFDLPEMAGLCDGESTDLEISVPVDNIIWSTGENTSIITVSDQGLVWAEASLGTCTFRDSTEVIVQALPFVDLGMDTFICSGTQYTLDATQSGAHYNWSTGDSSASISVVDAGTYTVNVGVNGCSNSDDITVMSRPSPVFQFSSNEISICDGEMATLDTGEPQWATTWSNGDSGNQINVSFAGTYDATTMLDGCSHTESVIVNVGAIPEFNLGPDSEQCEQFNTTLAVNLPSTDVMWSTGETGNSIRVDTVGTYSATVITDLGCEFTDEVTFSFRDCLRFNLYVPNAFRPVGAGSADNMEFKVTPSDPSFITSYEINIFDRWGNKLFESNDWNEGWNGGALGYQTLLPGVYPYTINVRYFDDFVTGRSEIIRGTVTLIR